jgi:hypothetical protein
MAASVERVRVVQPSALLKHLSRLLSVWHGCQQAYDQGVILFSWVYQIAQLVKAHTSGEEAQAQLLTLGHELQHSGLPTARVRVMTSVEKITVACAPQLCASVKPPLLPRTNHALERFIGRLQKSRRGRLQKSRRHSTGRKHTQALIRREGTFVAILLGLPQPDSWVEAFSRVNPPAFHHHLHRVRPSDQRRKCWPVRRD